MKRDRGALVVFAKDPVPGRVKTRLSPPFTPELAAAFYAAMLEDVLEASTTYARDNGLVPILAIDPPEAVAGFQTRVPTGFRVVAQRGRDLSQRMEAAAQDAFAAGLSPVLLRGSDSPAMEGETVRAACEALGRAGLVVCPDLDGGYNLVGLAEPAPGLFDHPMSTASVLDDTLARARAAGLRCEVLATGFDIDRIEDLANLQTRYAAGNCDHFRRTIRFLEEQGSWLDHSGDGA